VPLACECSRLEGSRGNPTLKGRRGWGWLLVVGCPGFASVAALPGHLFPHPERAVRAAPFRAGRLPAREGVRPYLCRSAVGFGYLRGAGAPRLRSGRTTAPTPPGERGAVPAEPSAPQRDLLALVADVGDGPEPETRSSQTRVTGGGQERKEPAGGAAAPTPVRLFGRRDGLRHTVSSRRAP
jgi:hypothetical protein